MLPQRFSSRSKWLYYKPTLSYMLRYMRLGTVLNHHTTDTCNIVGIDCLKERKINKGLGYTVEERQMLRIHGLQPAQVRTQEEQMIICKKFLNHYQEPLNKYVYLMDLCDSNEKLFYRLLSENIESLMPIVYTPTVGTACQKFGLIFSKPRGLFITINDAGHIVDILRNWPQTHVKAIVVTDGERILGLGDLGAYGMGIPIGKLALYTALAGVNPDYCLPITLDVGTNDKELLEDPLYIGIRQNRTRGKAYDDFIDEFMEAVVECFGMTCLIQFEDFGSRNAFRFLKKYMPKYCTFNDDIQGTASVVLAGILASGRITKKKISDNTIVFLGAGGAAAGIANMVVLAMVRDGLTKEQAAQKIWMVDINGLVTKGRSGGVDEHITIFAKDHPPIKDLASVVNEVKPSILIGASAAAGAFTPPILKAMASFNEKPVIFALSNPTIKAECTAEAAYTNTEGRAVFSSGSPFDKVEFKGKVFHPGQGNNAYIFPGVALGIILSGILNVQEHLFLIASDIVAKNVTEEDLAVGRVYPPISRIRECSIQIATSILEYAYAEYLTSGPPISTDTRAYVESHMYDYNYYPCLPPVWKWPDQPKIDFHKIQPT